MGMFSFNQNAGETPESIARKRKIADALLQQGTDTSPVQHWTQGLARIAQSLSGNYAMSRLDKAEAARRKGASDNFSRALMPGQALDQPAGNVAPTGGAVMVPGAVDKAGGVPNFPETQAYVQKLGLDGQQPPQVQPASYQPPQALAVQEMAQGLPSQQQLLAAINDPSFQFMEPAQQQIIFGLYTQQAERAAQQSDPAYQLGLKAAQLKLQQLENPNISPADQAKLDFERQKFEFEKAHGNPVWEKLSDFSPVQTQGGAPEGIDPSIWNAMTPEEKELWAD